MVRLPKRSSLFLVDWSILLFNDDSEPLILK
jgi:hypothetical protein